MATLDEVFDGEDTRAFCYGLTQQELDQLSDPFFILAAVEEEYGCPLALLHVQ